MGKAKQAVGNGVSVRNSRRLPHATETAADAPAEVADIPEHDPGARITRQSIFFEATHKAVRVLAGSTVVGDALSPRRTPPPEDRRALEPKPADSPAASADFWDVWMRHQDHLLRQCLGIMSGNVADAEDALSSAMIRASTRFGAYADEIVNERAWLSRLVRNSCIDHFRSESRHQRILGANGFGPDAARPGQVQTTAPAGAAAQPSPEQKAIDRNSLSRLGDDLNRLPEHLRAPLMMRFLRDMSYAEIAEALSLTNAAVRKRVQLARQRLRQTRV